MLSFMGNSHNSSTTFNGCKPSSFTLPDILLHLLTFSMYLWSAGLIKVECGDLKLISAWCLQIRLLFIVASVVVWWSGLCTVSPGRVKEKKSKPARESSSLSSSLKQFTVRISHITGITGPHWNCMAGHLLQRERSGSETYQNLAKPI